MQRTLFYNKQIFFRAVALHDILPEYHFNPLLYSVKSDARTVLNALSNLSEITVILIRIIHVNLVKDHDHTLILQDQSSETAQHGSALK